MKNIRKINSGVNAELTKQEKAEYSDLINLWNCSEPMTLEQVARFQKLDALAYQKQKRLSDGVILFIKKVKPWKQ